MGEVIRFPGRRAAGPSGGIIHVWRTNSGTYEVGHESRSGNSWGCFTEYATAQGAIEAAHRLNAEFGGDCEVFIGKDAMLALNEPRVQF